MKLPGYNEEFEPADVDQICVKLCQALKRKHPRWEIFLLEPEQRKGQKYNGLVNHVWDYILKRVSENPTTRRQSTRGTADPSVTDKGLETASLSSEVSFK